MLCRHCKYTIDDDSNFCKYCGIPISSTIKEFEKVFTFADFTRNKPNLSEVNTWLQTKSIRIKEVNIETFLNKAVIDSELVVKELRLKYVEIPQVGDNVFYRIHAFTEYTWNPRQKSDYGKLELKLNNWQAKNREHKIEWKIFTELENEAENNVNQAVFFIYT